MGLLEFQQGQRSKKMVVGKFRKPEKSKSWASGNSASPNQVKMGRRKIPQGQIKLKWCVGKFRKPKQS